MSPRFPMFIDIDLARCLVVGGGHVAARRAETLLRCGARVRVVSLDFGEPFAVLLASHENRLELVEHAFRPDDLDGVRLVTTATDDPQVNQQVGELCKARKIPVSIADAPEDSTFHFPGLVTRGPLSIGINTNGQSPSVSRGVRELIEMVLPDDYGDRILKQARKEMDA